jgi:hypothetical protein
VSQEKSNNQNLDNIFFNKRANLWENQLKILAWIIVRR